MKLAILTQIPKRNYGCILQNFALQTVLERAGHRVVTLDYTANSLKKALIINSYAIAAYIIKHLVFHPTRRYNQLPWRNQYSQMNRFIKKHLHILKSRHGLNDETVMLFNLDGVVVGSDQVWRPCYNKMSLPWMFCSFLNDGSQLPMVAYAASFGVGEWEYTPEQTEMARCNIKRFKAVSVREASGVELCRKHLGAEAVHVLDPTLLLDRADYMALVPKNTLARVPEGCVGVYILDLTERKKAIVDAVCRILGKRAVYFGCPAEGSDKYPSVESWLAHFERSSFIITDSFHGTAFSINFRRPFISIANQARGADRFTSLLNSVGLQERLISEDGTMSALGALARRSIDWGAVNNRLNQLRKHSMEFLEGALLKPQ